MIGFAPLGNWPEITDNLKAFIVDSVKDLGSAGALLGISGGIDSAVVAALAVQALGAENVRACLLPDMDSGDDMLRDARAVTEWLGIEQVFVKDMTSTLQAFGAYDMFPELYAVSREERQKAIALRKRALLPGAQTTGGQFLEGYRQKVNPELNRVRSFWNMKIRARMVVLYSQAELYKLAVLGTTNKSEYLTGWFTKYGDGAVDVEVILPLYKQRVFEIAAHLGVPEQICNKVPTGDILPGISDEEIMGVSYSVLDRILLGLERGVAEEELAREIGVEVPIVRHVAGLTTSSRHSRTGAMAPTLALA